MKIIVLSTIFFFLHILSYTSTAYVQQTQDGILDIHDEPSNTTIESGTLELSVVPSPDIKQILIDLAKKTKDLADMTIDKADDTIKNIKHAGDIASHGGGGEILEQWAKYWDNLSKGLDYKGNPLTRHQWRSMFQGADKARQWQEYKKWFSEQADYLQKLGKVITFVDSGSKMAGALWEGEGKIAMITLADEVCKVGAITFGSLFGAPWGPGGSIAGAFSAEELWRKFGSPSFDQRAQFVKNIAKWNELAGKVVQNKIGSLPEFQLFMEGKISEEEFKKKIRAYAEIYKKEKEKKKKQHQRELALLRIQSIKEPELKKLIDAWQDGKLPKSKKPLLIEALRRAIKEQKGDSVRDGDELECNIEQNISDVEDKTVSTKKKLSKKSKEDLLWCICWCTINPTLGVGASYNPKPIYGVLSSPGCKDPRYGPCVGAGYGCWRKHMISTGECFEKCVKDANVDKNSVIAEINQTRFDAFNEFIKEARGIIEEYIKFVPGVYRKKILGREYPNVFPLMLFAQSDILLASDSEPIRIISQKEVPMTYLEMIKEKNRQGHPDKALYLIKSAESIMPERKGEIHNILAEFAIILAKASLNIVTDLEFDEGLYMLNKSAEIYKEGENSSIGQNIKRLIGTFQRWKQDWQVLQSEVPNCLSMLKKRQLCKCDNLYKSKIYPSASSFTTYEFASPDRWQISTATGVPRAIPQKEKLFSEITNALSSSKKQCDGHPIFRTKEMKDLIDYENRKTLEKSPYIDQSELQKSSAPVMCGVNALKVSERLLSTQDLCDCHVERLENIIEIAKKDGEPLSVNFTVNSNEIIFGGRVEIMLQIEGGKAPFGAEMTGNYKYRKDHDNSRGFFINWLPDSVGTKVFKVTVSDACGEIIQKELYVNVKPSPAMLQCEAKWTEGTTLYNAKRYNEALIKFKENLACAPNNPQRQQYVAQLENTIRQQEDAKRACLALRQQGEQLVQQKRLNEAIPKYREYLKCNPDRQIEDYIKTLEATVQKEREQQQRVEYAKRLRAEGEVLERANRIQEAIGKYRESLKYVPDSTLEKHIKDLEMAMVRPTPTPVPTHRPPVVTPPPSSVTLTGLWIGQCEGMSKQYSININHNGNTFTAKSDYDEYSGNISGNQIRGKSSVGDDIMGSIINQNQIKITIAYKNISYQPLKCDLKRGNTHSTVGGNIDPSHPIAGDWNSNWGKVTFKAGNPITGSWDQGSGKIGQFSKGTYDPSTRILRIYYFQPWNNAIGWQKFKLSEDSKRLEGKPDQEGGFHWTCTR